MNDIAVAAIGILLIFMGYRIGCKQQIELIHSYHYKRVAEEDRGPFCKGVGIGNVLVGIGLLLFPVANAYLGTTAAQWITGVFIVAGLAAVLFTIIKFNKGLF